MKTVEVIDPHRVRFVLHGPWPDFMAFYASIATGAAWIVPRKYIEQVGDDAFKQKPVGLGPYRFIRMEPGVELVLEAQEHYWRKTPSIHRLIFKGSRAHHAPGHAEEQGGGHRIPHDRR